jgi:hypothetical protein
MRAKLDIDWHMLDSNYMNWADHGPGSRITHSANWTNAMFLLGLAGGDAKKTVFEDIRSAMGIDGPVLGTLSLVELVNQALTGTEH